MQFSPFSLCRRCRHLGPGANSKHDESFFNVGYENVSCGHEHDDVVQAHVKYCYDEEQTLLKHDENAPGYDEDVIAGHEENVFVYDNVE